MQKTTNESFKQLIVDTGLEMLSTGLTVGTWGNISVRDPESGYMYISPSGMDYKIIKPHHVVVLTDTCELIEGTCEPSIEKEMHAAVYRARADVNSVIHTHPIYSTPFGLTNTTMIGVSEDFIQIVGDEIYPAYPYELPGTMELGVTAVKALKDKNAVLLPGHGLLAVGSSLKMAFKVCSVVEKNAQILLFSKLLGGEVRRFTQHEIDAMQSFAKNHYGKKNESM
ncbi:MAG: class II aldolase/adducin family protein [Sphaerochaeta sp.]|nr:class II aldolase/adducin family protein [Sphaerochaeta sp.]